MPDHNFSEVIFLHTLFRPLDKRWYVPLICAMIVVLTLIMDQAITFTRQHLLSIFPPKRKHFLRRFCASSPDHIFSFAIAGTYYNYDTFESRTMSSGLGGLCKSPNGVVLGMVQLQLPVVKTPADLAAQTQKIVDMVVRKH